MSKKILKSGILYTIGNLLIQGLAFITLPIYTRIISVEDFGKYSLYTSWTSLVALFIGLQLSGSLSIAKIKFEEKYHEYSINILMFSNIFFIAIVGCIVPFLEILSTLLNYEKIVIIYILFQSYASYLLGFLGQYFIQKQESIKSLVYSATIAVSTVLLSIVLVYNLENDFHARIYGGLIPAVLMSIYILIYLYKSDKIAYKKKYITFALGISVPLIFHHLGHNILTQFDRIMIGQMLGDKDVALYSFAYSIGLILQIVLGSVNTVWVPFYFKEKKNNNSELKKIIKKYLVLGLILTLGYLTVVPELALIMGGEKYLGSIDIIPLIVLSYFFVFLYTFPVNIQFYFENTKLIPLATLIAGVINIGLNFMIIPAFGIYGAAMTTVVSYMILLILHHIVAKIKYEYTEVSVIEYVILSVLSLSYAYLMIILKNEIILRYIIILIVLIIVITIYKKDIQGMIKSYKKEKK